ncbi:MAG: MoxR family ATPase [Flavobacteriales bacterium]|jgi:MoxR-like ATPase|nr:MoxR family ATPase [Flavobacteriales bacterium]MDB4340379.1 MoxR family ATPase [Crocinitomicaceae bacterium]MDC3308769.1 MoxR family ATPase [Crocinitomicaceae bacterium]
MSELKASENNESVNPADHLRKLNDQIALEKMAIEQLKKEISKVIIGQGEMIDSLIIALLTEGHVLLEGLPGLAKTLTVKTLSQAMSLDFSRIQFTPDLLPADVTGTMIYQQKSESFAVRKGPLFASFILADEINRAPAKVQSALLEAMQERQVTIGEESFKLPDPFLVMATQNPIEQEGTYNLPEAQKDRFMMKVSVGYPSPAEEALIIRSKIQGSETEKVKKALTKKDVLRLKALVKEVYLDEKIEKYIVDIINETRNPSIPALQELAPYISYGSSPRGGINLALASKARAFMEGRSFVTPDDIKVMSIKVLNHRIGLTYEAEVDELNAEDIIHKIVQYVEVP